MKQKPPYADEVAAIKERIRLSRREQVGKIRKEKYYYVLMCIRKRKTWASVDNEEKDHTTSFYVGTDTAFDRGNYYSNWHIHLTEDLTSACAKKFNDLQEAVEWSRNLPFETVVAWRVK